VRLTGIALAMVVLFLCAADPARAADLPPNLRSMLEKSASLHLTRFPIGFWNYTSLKEDGARMDEAEVEEWADAGFTVTMSPRFDPTDAKQMAHLRRMLKWAEQRGMKLILCDPRTYGPRASADGKEVPVPKDQAEKIAAAVKDFRTEPAVFGFEVGDEPDVPAMNAFLGSYRLTKEAAPQWHPFANFLPYYGPGLEKSTTYPTWADYLNFAGTYFAPAKLDFLCYDCYTQMLSDPLGVDIYFGNLRLYREMAWQAGMPFWTTLLAVGHFDYRCPSYDDLRWQFNTALASGANGLMWFHYYLRGGESNYRSAPVDENWDRTQTYYDLRRIQKAFHRRYGDLFQHLAPTRVTFYPVARGAGQVFTPDELVSEITVDAPVFVDPEGKRHELRDPNHPLLLGEFVDLQGGRYVMLVNNSTEKSVRVALKFPGSDVKLFSWADGHEQEGLAYSADVNSSRKMERTEKGLRVWHWLAPGQEAVYRVDSELARNAKITVP